MKSILGIAALVAVAGSASADVIASWDFEDATKGSNYASSGVYGIADLGVLTAGSSASANTSGGTVGVYSTPVGNGSARSISSNGWDTGEYFEIRVATTGYNNISFGWDQARSGTGPADFTLRMSTDGGSTFTNLLSNYTVAVNGSPNTAWTSGTYQGLYNFAPVGAGFAAVNNSLVIFRLVSNVTTSSAGTNRIDNVTVYGEVIPTPGSLALVGLGGLVATRRRR
jgi:hypothetical protein